MNVKFKGNYVTLEGTHVKVGHPSPKFVVTDQELNAVESKNFTGKKVYVSVPSMIHPFVIQRFVGLIKKQQRLIM